MDEKETVTDKVKKEVKKDAEVVRHAAHDLLDEIEQIAGHVYAEAQATIKALAAKIRTHL